MADAARRVFRFGSLRIGVSVPDGSHLDWLAEFLLPAFAVEPASGTGKGADHEVVLRADADAYAALLARRAGGAAVAAFALDSGPVELPRWSAPRGEVVVHDEARRVFYHVTTAGSRVEVLAARGGPMVREPLMRVVRELATARALAEGDLLLHASCFGLPGVGGVVVAGPRGAGKTTLLLAALRRGAAPVSNDRVLVGPGPGGRRPGMASGGAPRARGLPTYTTVRPGTLTLFPEIGRRVRSEAYLPRLTRAEAARRDGRRPRLPDGRYSLSPGFFHRLAGSTPLGEVPAAALVFLPGAWQPGNGAGAGKRGAGLAPLDPAGVPDRLARCLLGARHGSRRSALFGSGGEAGPDAGESRRRMEEVALRVPAFEWRPPAGSAPGDLLPALRARLSPATPPAAAGRAG